MTSHAGQLGKERINESPANDFCNAKKGNRNSIPAIVEIPTTGCICGCALIDCIIVVVIIVEMGNQIRAIR